MKLLIFAVLLMVKCLFSEYLGAQTAISGPNHYHNISKLKIKLEMCPTYSNNTINSFEVLDTLPGGTYSNVDYLPFNLHVDLKKFGKKIKQSSDTTIWIMAIHSATATGIALVTSRLFIPEGSNLFIYDKSFTHGYLFQHKNNPKKKKEKI